MKEHKHTKGPWEFKMVGGTPSVMIENQGIRIAMLPKPDVVTTPEHIIADGHLLAASVDLLDAVRATLFQLTQGKVLDRDACVTQMRAAYAKATGGDR